MSTTNRRALTGTTLLVLAVLFLALVLLSSVLLRGARLDLTRNGLYTLSSGTEAILDKLQEPVKLHFYYSDQAARDIPQLRTYATRVRELLEEIAAKSGGKVALEVIDPLPFSEQEDRATAAGLQAVPIGNGGDSLFFGLVGSNSTDGEATIPFFQPDKEAFLEYDVAKLISSLSTDALPRGGPAHGPEHEPRLRSAIRWRQPGLDDRRRAAQAVPDRTRRADGQRDSRQDPDPGTGAPEEPVRRNALRHRPVRPAWRPPAGLRRSQCRGRAGRAGNGSRNGDVRGEVFRPRQAVLGLGRGL
jgi:hypothetical protein